MGKIIQLDKQLSNKIAAGEVIERPANVVKELVENSIDAQATTISIYIEDAGLKLIRIIDDGEGMDKVDARMCLSTHATSKIKNDFDLFNITTLGFRGEAIPSIASISHFTIKTSQGETGYSAKYEFGDLIEELDSDAKRGTTMSVSNLFQNVPARLKYLKSIQSEFSHIQGFVEKFALANPQIAFELYHQNKIIFKTSGNNQMLEVIGQIYGLAVAKNMIAISCQDDEFAITGYISKIDTTRASKTNIITLINQRVVRNAMSIEAVNLAYRDYLASDRYPIAFINIEIDPYLVDVNVHPAKMEVRFSKENQLKDLIYNAVKTALNQNNLTYEPKNKPTERETYRENYEQPSFNFNDIAPRIVDDEKQTVNQNIAIIKEEVFNYDQDQNEEIIEHIDYEASLLNTIEEDVIKEVEKPIKKKIYAKTQIHGSYIVGETQEGLYLVDQHAAQERVNYEYFKTKFENFDKTYQDLLVPIVFEFPLSESIVLKEQKTLLNQFGIELEEFGDRSFVVKKIPVWMINIDEKTYIDAMIEQILTNQKVDIIALQEHAIATLSCKASIKANTYLNTSGMQAVLDDLMRCDNPYVCPHGRPTIIFYSAYELEKLFKRVV